MIQEEHLSVIKKVTVYICKICHNCKYPDTTLIFGQYDQNIFEKADTERSEWISKTCDKPVKKVKFHCMLIVMVWDIFLM